MNRFSALLLVSLLAAPALPAMAQHTGHGGHMPKAHGDGPMPMGDMKLGATGTANGEIRHVDAAARSVTIKHDEFKGELVMRAMTMDFSVDDPALLASLKPGQRVRFTVDYVETGMRLIKVKPLK